LRRQILSPWRKPLIVMTPKSLLRHIEAVSPLDDFSKGSFRKILHDKSGQSAEGVTKILLCTGKIYYELDKKREDLKRHDVAILRFEQLYPLRDEEIEEALKPYATDVPVVWVQEEPANMGALPSWIIRFGESIGGHPFSAVSRPASASPATGSGSSHRQEQEQVLSEAFSI
jgi:2-oxoglutarate dehydrogenase E1 component